MRILFLPGTYSSPASRFRIHQFVPYLQKAGFEVDVHVIHPERDGAIAVVRNDLHRKAQARTITLRRIMSLTNVFLKAPTYDVIMMNRDIIPEVKIMFLEPLLARCNRRLIFDFDDAIHLSREAKMQKILPHFAVITPGNENLATYARAFHSDVRIWPTVVDTDYYHPSNELKLPDTVRIGWSGSTSSGRVDLPTIEPVVTKLAKKIDFEFVVVSNTDPNIKWPGVKVKFIQWTPETEIEGLHQIDIGIMPLEDGPFQRGKCSLKAIQYMGNGIPAIVSPIGANVTTVIHGETGFHASSEEEWIERLIELVRNQALRKQMGLSAREHVVANYSIRSLLPRMIETFEYVASL